MTRTVVVLAVLLSVIAPRAGAQSPLAPVIVVETVRGTFEIETYPDDAPKTVAHVIALVKDGFYDGQRVHRVIPGFVIQWGDPRSRDLEQQGDWGLGPEASSGHPVGVAEMPTRHKFVKGSVGLAHPGVPSLGDSQIFVTLADRPDLNGRYTLFGLVVAGEEVPAKIQVGDVIIRMTVKEPPRPPEP